MEWRVIRYFIGPFRLRQPQAATPAAATETWSPGEKPDFQKILQTAQTLTSEGSYEEALQHFLWYFNHTRNDPGQAGVRLSFALSDWVELGRRYPKAKKALTEIRDADARLLAEGKGYFQLFQEVSGINQYLEEEKLTLDLFATLESHDRQLAGKCYPIVQGLLVQKRQYRKMSALYWRPGREVRVHPRFPRPHEAVRGAK